MAYTPNPPQNLRPLFHSWFAVVFYVFISTHVASGANAQEESASVAPHPEQTEIDTALVSIDAYRENLVSLYSTLATTPEDRRDIVDARIARTLNRLIAITQGTAGFYLDAVPNAPELENKVPEIIRSIELLDADISAAVARVGKTVKLPTMEQSAAEQAALSATLQVVAERAIFLIEASIENVRLAEQLGMDTQSARTTLRRGIEQRANSTSAYLDVMVGNLVKLRHQSRTLPDDKEIAAKIAVAKRLTGLTAGILKKLAEVMESVGMDSTEVNAQLISTTGELTTEIFRWNVIRGVATDFGAGIVQWFTQNGVTILFRILMLTAILIIAWKLAAIVEALTRRALESKRVRFSQLLRRMIVATARTAVLVLGILIGLSQLGISLGPLLAGLGIAGFIIGFAVQDSLSNFASGLMILIYRPFDVGDLVEVDGGLGRVRHMSLVNTTIGTIDNQQLIVPNNRIWQNVIKNMTATTTRGIVMHFGISYADDIKKAEKVLADIVGSHEKILKSPEPVIKVDELGDSSVNFLVRPWVRTEDYFDVYWDITREVKLRFDAEGISIPFPQRDVHLYDANAAQT